MIKLIFLLIVPLIFAGSILISQIVQREPQRITQIIPDNFLNTITGSKTLNLSNKGLKSLPAEIGNLSKTEEFYVDHNQLTGALPAEIRKMSNLRIIDASDNQLTGIPAEIGQLYKLEAIDFSNNKIDTFPNEIANLKNNLKTLNLKNNTFSETSIGQLKTMLPNTEIIY